MNAPPPHRILSVPVHPVTYTQTLDLFGSYIASGIPHQICTVNPEFVMRARQLPEFMAVLQQADLCLPDGVGLLWAARWQGHSLPERVAGSTMMYRLAERASQTGWRIFLLGAAPGVARETALRLARLYPGARFVGTYAGNPTDSESPTILNQILAVKPDILLVAFGAPKQDLWIRRYFADLNIPVMMGVGGSFDFVAGVAIRAPLWLQNLGLEWLHRLWKQPWRWRRMMALPQFCWQILTERAGKRV